MKLALLYRCCSRQLLGRRTTSSVLLSKKGTNGIKSLITCHHQESLAFFSSTNLNFPGFLPPPPGGSTSTMMMDDDVAPVVEDALDEDIADEQDFGYYEEEQRVAVRRIMSPTEASYSVVGGEQEEQANQFDQDYDQYTLHMSTFQAYNVTHEYQPPGDLGILDPEDCVELEEVQHNWEEHPDAYTDTLPPASSVVSDEFVPDVEDI